MATSKVFKVSLLYGMLLIWTLTCVNPVRGGEPMEQVKKDVDKAIEILSNSKLSSKEKRKRIFEIVDVAVDWREVAKRVLAIHWRRRTPQEREEFVRLFKDFVEASYADRLEKYSGEKVHYVGERIEGDYASVMMKVITKKNETISMECRLFKKGERWLIYDILIEGVSMVNNYRVQVNEIIVSSSFKNLIKKLKSKKKTSS